MRLLSTLTSEKYTLTSDPSVVFTLRPLKASDRIDILGTATDAKKYGQAMLQACEYAITDWTGVKDDAGNAVEYSIVHVRDLPIEAMIEVSNHVLKLSKVAPDEKKASGSPSQS